MKSPEGIPWKEYKILQLLPMLPLSFIGTAYLELMCTVAKKKSKLINVENVPPNAILYGFHEDVTANYMAMTLLSDRNMMVKWISYHGFWAYSTFFCGMTGRYENVRYARRREQKPLDQIVSLFESHPNRIFGIFTDAGGNRNKVRQSLLNLSLKTSRPLVPLRSKAARSLMIGHDQWPILWSEIEVNFGEAIWPHELEKTPEAERLPVIQRRIENLS